MSTIDWRALRNRSGLYTGQFRRKVSAGPRQPRPFGENYPSAGWYLSGQEDADLIFGLSDLIRANEWEQADDTILAHLPKFKANELKEWMRTHAIPEYCVKRLSLFLAKHEGQEYETATYLGIPLMDEISRYLHDGKSLTSKRASNRRSRDQSKPELGFTTASGRTLERFHKEFVEAFGSLQEEPQMTRLSDENYWNRHAIVHGMMKRSMGEKDSAKCLMAIAFLIFAFNDAKYGTKGIRATSHSTLKILGSARAHSISN